MPAGGTSCTPSSRWTSRSDRRRSSSRSAGGHADQLGDHVHRQLAGEVGDEVEACPASSAGVEVLAGELADARLELGDAARGEAARHQAAHAAVPGRVHGEERHRAVGVRARRGRVERHAVGRREARRCRGTPSITSAWRDSAQKPRSSLRYTRRLVAQAGVGRVRVLVDLVGVRAVDERRSRSSAAPPRSRPATSAMRSARSA